MTVVAGAKKVREGLVLSYDMYNEKSWRGRPTTNLVPDPLTMPASSWDARDNVTITYNELDPYGTRNAVRITPNSATDNYFGVRQDNLGVGTYSTSLWIKATKSTTMTLNTGNGGSASGRVREVVAIDTEWKYVSYTGNISVDGIHTFHVGGWGTWSDNSFDIFIAYPQVEFQPFSTPFVNGERTDTQSVFDLTKKSTLRASSLVYLEDNTLEFDGTSSYLEIDNGLYGEGITGKTVIAVVSMDTDFGDPATPFYRAILGTNAAAGMRNFNFYIRSSTAGFQLHFSAGNGTTAVGTLTGAFPMNFETPFFIAASHELSGTIKYYLNGNVIATGSQSFYQPNAGVSEYLGMADNRWKGFVYTASVYHKALSEDEIRQNYLAYRNRFGL